MKRKIVYCLPSLYMSGGMERVLTIKANYFTDVLGYDVYIILTDGKGKPNYFELSPKVNVIQLDINYEELWSQSLIGKIKLYLNKQRIFKRKLNDSLCQLQPDITVSMLRREINFINSIPDGSIKLGEIHVNRSNFRNLSNEKSSHFIKKRLATYWMNQLIKEIKKLSKFIVLTEMDKTMWTELTNVCVISNPLPFYPTEQSSCTSKRVIAVGRLVHEKGFDMLIPAWKRVSDKHPNWTLHIYGDGDQKQLESLIESLKLQSTCLLEGAETDIESRYRESSIFALSSRFEGFGMVICEAMACGLPAVAFDCPHGPREIIKQNEDGFLVANGDIEKLAERICFLIEHEDIRKEMGRKARINAERFKVEKIAQEWEALFNKLITNNKALKNKTMSWYTKYLSAYEKPLQDIPLSVISEIKDKLASKQNSQPVVSVVVIAHNEEKHLLSCLWSLSESKCNYPMEIIGVNNNSTDRTEDAYNAVELPHFMEMQKSCGYARRCGLEHAKGKYYICIDADTMYPPSYIETLVNELEKKGVVAVSSLWSYVPDKDHPWLGLKIYELMRDTHLFIQSFQRPEMSVRGLVFAYNIEFGRKVGYRVDIIRGEDGSMALGLKQFGKIHFVRSRKARAVTGYGTVSADGTFFNSFKIRIVKYLKELRSYFSKRDEYKDDESNLIK